MVLELFNIAMTFFDNKYSNLFVVDKLNIFTGSKFAMIISYKPDSHVNMYSIFCVKICWFIQINIRILFNFFNISFEKVE